MNHPTAQFLTALLAITPLADAFTCRPGRAYCGYHLMAGGNQANMFHLDLDSFLLTASHKA